MIVDSGSKLIGGDGSWIGGVMVDSGKLNWDNGKLAGLVEGDESYDGICYGKDVGEAGYIRKGGVELLGDLGCGV